MRVLDVGADALLVEVDGIEEVTALRLAAESARHAGDLVAGEIVPAARTVLFDGAGPGTRAWLARWSSRTTSPVSSASRNSVPVVEIPVRYDGPDLVETARLLGCSPTELITRHTGTDFTVAFCGFAPGFAYCIGWDFDVPRLETPRVSVPSGSVAIAGEFTSVYPQSSPGGWRLIGNTTVRMWDQDRDSPALLAPGTRVRFVEISI